MSWLQKKYASDDKATVLEIWGKCSNPIIAITPEIDSDPECLKDLRIQLNIYKKTTLNKQLQIRCKYKRTNNEAGWHVVKINKSITLL